ncbi:MAG TPA: chemotaxis protein CheW [Thermoanaerobaculia bacterium]|nr:chemotaxis protein CheW [Thermoanaerobaculia bacterium]
MKKKQGGGPEPQTAPGSSGGTFQLPESGLAEDILRALAASGTLDEVVTERPAEPLAPTVPAVAASGSLQGPERVYAFIDRLERRITREAEVVREKPETWVSFELAGEIYALPVERLQEVLRITSITRVPHAPDPIRGITNMRGRVLAVVDLRVRLGLPSAELEPQNRILVVASRDHWIGLLVDSARQVAKVLPSAVQPPPSDVMTARSDFIRGLYHLEDELVILLDVDRVLLIHESLDQALDA